MISKNKLNYIYNSAYQILLIVMPLITTPYLSRTLGAEMIGSHSYAQAIAYYFVIFIMLGLNNYGNRSIAFCRDNKKTTSKVFSEIYTMQLIVSAIITLLYIVLLIASSGSVLSWILLLYVISASLDINWLFFGLGEFKAAAAIGGITRIISALSIFIFIKSSNDIWIYTLIYSLSALINHIVLIIFAKKIIQFKRVSIKTALRHLKPNLFLFIPVIAVSLYKIMDKIMLGNLSNIEQVGFYENAEKITQVPIALITSLGTVMLPKMSNLAAKNKIEESRQYIRKSINFAVLLSSLFSFGIISMANLFVPWYFGQGYETCIELLNLLMPSCIFIAVANVIRTQFLIPFKQDKLYVISVLSGAIINLFMNLLLIPDHGSVGAAIGTLSAEASVCIIQVLLCKKKVGIIEPILESMPYIIIGVIVGTIAKFTPDISGNNFLNMAIKTIVECFIYFVAVAPIISKQGIINVKQLRKLFTTERNSQS